MTFLQVLPEHYQAFLAQTRHVSAGTVLPLGYPLPEKGIFILPYQTISLTGKDRYQFLSNLTTADMKYLTDTGLLPTLFLDTSGKTVCLSALVKLGEELLIAALPNDIRTLLSYLEYFHIREDVAFEQTESGRVFFIMYGDTPGQAVCGASYTASHYNFCSDIDTPELYENLAKLGFHFADEETFAQTRFALNFPMGEADFPKRSYPHEQGLAHFISFTKGCFVGQEPVSRMEHKFPPSKQRVVVYADKPLTAGSHIIAEGDRAGRILQAASRPYCGKYYAFAQLKTDLIKDPETVLTDDETGTPLNLNA